MDKTIYCIMADPGQSALKFVLPWEGGIPDRNEVELHGSFIEKPTHVYLRRTRSVCPGDISDIQLEDGILTVEIEPISMRENFTLTVAGKSFDKDSFDVITEGEELFDYCEEGDVLYRLYSPQAKGPRPMILFLHGGGNGGTLEGPQKRDNRKHILADYGPINFAQKYPDMYIMAPMAIEEEFDPAKMAALLKTMCFSKPFDNPDFGWSRRYLGEVCDIIRRMVDEGKVDGSRIYVTGMSMGGGGTIRAMSVGADLFAACAPVCPTMNPDTFNILRTLKAPVWVSSAYVDHTVYRHKYLVDAVMQLKDDGNRDAHLTLYSPEELAEYDIGIEDNVPYEKIFRENHAAWVPTYHNEHGIMTWLLNHVKK